MSGKGMTEPPLIKPLPPVGRKPPLPIDFDLPPSFAAPDPSRPRRVIGFVMPKLIAIRVMPLEVPVELDNKQSAVGVVQLSEDVPGLAAGVYRVAVDLGQDGDTVEGSLMGDDGSAVQLTFRRTHLIRNPERDEFERKYGLETEDSNIHLGIPADSLWFAVAQDVQDKRVVRYSAEGDDSVLSTRRNFPDQYGEIEASMRESAKILEDNGLLNGHTVIIERSIAEIEDPARIAACKEQGQCDPDIIVAPTRAPIDEPDSSSRIVAVVRVVQVLNIDDIIVEPGSYVLKIWRDADDQVLIGAAFNGVTENGNDVEDQQIPAVPARFVSADGGTGEPNVEITGVTIKLFDGSITILNED